MAQSQSLNYLDRNRENIVSWHAVIKNKTVSAFFSPVYQIQILAIYNVTISSDEAIYIQG